MIDYTKEMFKISRRGNRMYNIPNTNSWRRIFKRDYEGERFTSGYRKSVQNNLIGVDPGLSRDFIFNVKTNRFNFAKRFIDRRFKNIQLKPSILKAGVHEISSGRFDFRAVVPLDELRQSVLHVLKTRLEKSFQLTLKSNVIEGLEKTFNFNSYGHFEHWISHILGQTIGGGSNQSVKYRDVLRLKETKDAFKYILSPAKNISYGGGCRNDRGDRKNPSNGEKEKVGDFYRFKTFNPTSQRNNCGIECLRAIDGVNLPERSVRKELGIPSNTFITPEQIYRIYKKYNTNNKDLVFIDYTFDDVYMEKNFNYLLLEKGHYKLVRNMKKRGRFTKRINELESILQQSINVLKRRELQTEIDKLWAEPMMRMRNLKRGLLTFDFETRMTDETKTYGSSTGRKLKDAIVKFVYRRVQKTKIHQDGFASNDVKTSARQFLDWLRTEHRENRHYTCIAHNGAKFDFYLLFKDLKKNELLHTAVRLRGTSIIEFEFCGHVFKDSYCFLTSSLDNLCHSFKVSSDNAKLKKFQYDGKELSSMEMCFYKPNLTFNQFMNLQNVEPTFWKLYEKYCLNDCLSLFEIWTKFEGEFDTILTNMGSWLKQFCSLKSNSTIAGLGMSIVKRLNKQDKFGYRKQQELFFKDDSNCADIQCSDIHHTGSVGKKCLKCKYHFICEFKRGGISHCHQPGRHKHSVTSFDITSQYPAAMVNIKIPTGRSRWTYVYEPTKHGYYHLKNMVFDLPGNIKSFKPVCASVKSKTASLNWNTGDFIDDCYVDSEMIHYLKEHYALKSFEVIEGLISNSYVLGKQFFGDYINSLFKEKKRQDNFKGTPEYNSALREGCKLFQNSVSGKLVEDGSRYFQVKFVMRNDEKKSSINKCDFEKDYGKFKPNLWVGCGVMMYSYSKRLLFEYIRMLPNDSDNIIHVETDGIYFDSKYSDIFRENVKTYKGKYSVAVGNELGNIKLEHRSIGDSFWVGKKCYYMYCGIENKEIMRVLGIPQSTIDENGVKKQLIFKQTYEDVINGTEQKIAFQNIKRELWAGCEMYGFEQTRTMRPRMRNYPVVY